MKKLAMRQAMVLAGKKSIFLVLALMNCVTIDASNVNNSRNLKKGVPVQSAKSNKMMARKAPVRRTFVQPAAKSSNPAQDHVVESDEYSKVVSQAPLQGHVDHSVDVKTQELPDGSVIQTQTTVQPVEEEGIVVTTTEQFIWKAAKYAAIGAAAIGLGAAAYYNQDAIKNGFNAGYQSANNWWNGSDASLGDQDAFMNGNDHIMPNFQRKKFASVEDAKAEHSRRSLAYYNRSLGLPEDTPLMESDDLGVNPSQEQQGPNLPDENSGNGSDQDLGMQDATAMESDESGYSDTAKAAGAGLVALGTGFAASRNPGVRQAVQKGLQKSSDVLRKAPLMPTTASKSIAAEQIAAEKAREIAEQSKKLQAYWNRRYAADAIDKTEQLLKQPQAQAFQRAVTPRQDAVLKAEQARIVNNQAALGQVAAAGAATGLAAGGSAAVDYLSDNQVDFVA